MKNATLQDWKNYMKILELRPIKDSAKDYEKIEMRIKRAFLDLLYKPLLKELSIKIKVSNAREDLIEGLRSGKVTFSQGAFRGQFNASISKELRSLGAVWDRKTSSFKIRKADLPYPIREAIGVSEIYFQQKLARIDKKLSQILPVEIADKINVTDLFDSALFKVEKDFQKSIEKITVAPELTASQRVKIASEWQNNMDLWIKGFAEEHIKQLRKTVRDSALKGNRFESLTKGIQTSYGVTARKAKFLARQETNLLMASFKEARYIDAGVNSYRWGCVKMPHDKTPHQHIPGNVRYAHGILEGKIFRFDDPPVTSNPGEPERRNNPMQDYNCRCFARPIVKF